MNAKPKLVHLAIARWESGEPLQVAVNWTWDRADPYDRLAIDDWLVANDHPLGHLVGTHERRFTRLVQETIDTDLDAKCI